MGYPAILFLAALWAMVERTRTPAQIPTPLGLNVAAADSMAARELEADRAAA
jgi:hypothetical protein